MKTLYDKNIVIKNINGVEIKFKKKSDARVLNFIFNYFLKFFIPDFMTRFWTTIFTTIYVPNSTDLEDTEFEKKHTFIISHEVQHIADFKRYHIFFLLTYLLPPVFNYMRFVWERRASCVQLDYLINVRNISKTNLKNNIDAIAYNLASSNYLWAWPEKWIKSWFYKKYKIDA